jgi:hypothetical protein
MLISRTLLAQALCWTAVGCVAPTTAEPATYIGEVDGSPTRIALAVQDGSVQAYVCGSGATLQAHTRWFVGMFDGAGELAARADDWKLSARRVNDGVVGELVSPDGERLTWSAPLANAGNEVGLYDVDVGGCRSGVIVWEAQPGDACRAQGSYCGADHLQHQVTPVVCRDDMPIEVQIDDTDLRLQVDPVNFESQ